ncbi:hypothetical protein [Schaalia sp. Marseille-Q2122]|uniref:hypothetical protein n=1 Tax=Schaalia sp. Marseille-Q2122 TaxID=2736604 RepID=UPI00158EFF2A|nr:hypothetical protein [Schaalia sp. Marseille-Q2122]
MTFLITLGDYAEAQAGARVQHFASQSIFEWHEWKYRVWFDTDTWFFSRTFPYGIEHIHAASEDFDEVARWATVMIGSIAREDSKFSPITLPAGPEGIAPGWQTVFVEPRRGQLITPKGQTLSLMMKDHPKKLTRLAAYTHIAGLSPEEILEAYSASSPAGHMAQFVVALGGRE